MRPMQFAPMVVYGTMTSNYSKLMNGGDGICLSFLFIDPITGKIPMTSGAFTVLFNNRSHWGWDGGDVRRAKSESEEIYNIFSKLALTNGLARLWATPANLLVQGDRACFDAISEKICKVMTEVLGEIKFHEVPHGEAAPLFSAFTFKKIA